MERFWSLRERGTFSVLRGRSPFPATRSHVLAQGCTWPPQPAAPTGKGCGTAAGLSHQCPHVCPRGHSNSCPQPALLAMLVWGFFMRALLGLGSPRSMHPTKSCLCHVPCATCLVPSPCALHRVSCTVCPALCVQHHVPCTVCPMPRVVWEEKLLTALQLSAGEETRGPAEAGVGSWRRRPSPERRSTWGISVSSPTCASQEPSSVSRHRGHAARPQGPHVALPWGHAGAWAPPAASRGMAW